MFSNSSLRNKAAPSNSNGESERGCVTEEVFWQSRGTCQRFSEKAGDSKKCVLEVEFYDYN